MRTHATPVAAALAALCAAACVETFIADDVAFDQWCGDTLCHWDVDAGKIEKVGTWHRSDSAVKLIGKEAQISQVQKDFQGSCIKFELIADVEASTRTTLQLDFNDDGTVDVTQALPTEPWKPDVFLVRTPARFNGVRFILHKAAAGRAVIAQMGASTPDEECSGPPLELGPQNANAACKRDADCAEGVCAAGACSPCAADGICKIGEGCSEDAHCGEGACAAGKCSLCAADGSCKPGAGCSEDAHCGGGHCTTDVCSACASDGECADGEACALLSYPVSAQRACIDENNLDERDLGQACSRDSQCTHGYTCTATGDDLPLRCGMACSGPKDEGCRKGTHCVELLTYFDEDWNADGGFVCIEASDCEHTEFGECLDPSGASLEL